MVTNEIKKINSSLISLPVIVKSDESDQKGWLPTFEYWETKAFEGSSYIECTQSFLPEIKRYKKGPIDPKIGYYNQKGDLIIKWIILVDDQDLDKIHKFYQGDLKATTWLKRYCLYFSANSRIWLHQVLLNPPKGYEVHHINNVSQDNRRNNLHLLPKKVHNSGIHLESFERKIIFAADLEEYHRERKSKAIEDFINQMALNIIDDKNYFIAQFAKENMALTREILQIARYNINLSQIKDKISEDRLLNPHLDPNYLDAFAIEIYLKNNETKKDKAKKAKAKKLIKLDDLELFKSHDIDNFLSSALACKLVGVKRSRLRYAKATGEHRIQYVKTVGQTVYYNDSKGTNVGATLAACNSFAIPVHLMVGGVGKGQSFENLFNRLPAHVEHVYIFGADSELIKSAGESCGFTEMSVYNTMSDAFNATQEKGLGPRVVLLSPACASFDEFKNYAERGERFIEMVEGLSNDKTQ